VTFLYWVGLFYKELFVLLKLAVLLKASIAFIKPVVLS
jgi:hypothetical protein